MNSEIKIMSREVWSGAVRLAHACLLVSVLALMATGWLIASAPSLAQDASEYHHLLAVFFAVSLGFRILLLFTDKNSGHWRRMVQAWPKPSMVGKMMLFYLTFGRSTLPKWYAHNFMWVPLYFLLFVVLLLQTVAGVLMIYEVELFIFYLPDLHRFFASTILWFVVFHIYAVILHDMKSKNANISAMINGYRYFEADLGQGASQQNPRSGRSGISPKGPN
jgi:Ni/Fe-hydrogenase 1 B-type cytochrome subunit